MFLKIVFLALFVTVVMSQLSLETQWTNYKNKFGKSYSPEEDRERFEIFKESVKFVNDVNKKYEEGTGTWTAELNRFSDLREEEKKQFQGYLSSKKGATGTF